jgi:hypothetical protein
MAELHANSGEMSDDISEDLIAATEPEKTDDTPTELVGGRTLYGAVDYKTMVTAGIASIHGLHSRRHDIVFMPRRFPVRGIGGVAMGRQPRV